MKYGSVPVGEAVGAILAHSMRPGDGSPIRKGTVLTREHVSRFEAAGVSEVLAALLEPGDVLENEAATRLAVALAGDCIRAEAAATGRVNLYAESNGLLAADRRKVDSLNRIDPGITLATLDHLRQVSAGQMVATVKIIPYSVAQSSLDAAVKIAAGKIISVEPFRAMNIGVVATRLPHLKESVMDKTMRVLEGRLAPSGSRLTREIRTGHDEADVTAAVGELLPENDMVLVFGASAICDIDDVIPAAIRKLGGDVEHFGMPVDPGNLMLLGDIGGKPVIGAPGCARSPAENGFDWVLQRLLAGRRVTAEEITGMGVGGLLMEIGIRPRPREAGRRESGQTAAVILAAGQSRRMGANKLVAKLEGKALVRHVAEAALASKARQVIVVTGHEAGKVGGELSGLDVTLVHNPAYSEGLASSLAAGIGAIDSGMGAAIILLGDMPRIDASMIDRMIKSSSESPKGSIVLATFNGKRGNPVLWPAEFFDRLTQISGDTGARHLIGENSGRVVQVELGEAASFDIDTPEALANAGGELAV